MGYEVVTNGQKGYNGVALLSKLPIKNVIDKLPGDEEDTQARWISAEINNVLICDLYLPNGNPYPGPKFDYKISWMNRLYQHSANLIATEKKIVLLGDYNIIPTETDCNKPDDWKNDALFQPQSRKIFQGLLNLGFTDAIRAKSISDGIYTHWDYQRGAWSRNSGIRIDHVLVSPTAADSLVACGIDREMRDKEKPSDHVPIWIKLQVV